MCVLSHDWRPNLSWAFPSTFKANHFRGNIFHLQFWHFVDRILTVNLSSWGDIHKAYWHDLMNIYTELREFVLRNECNGSRFVKQLLVILIFMINSSWIQDLWNAKIIDRRYKSSKICYFRLKEWKSTCPLKAASKSLNNTLKSTRGVNRKNFSWWNSGNKLFLLWTQNCALCCLLCLKRNKCLSRLVSEGDGYRSGKNQRWQ